MTANVNKVCQLSTGKEAVSCKYEWVGAFGDGLMKIYLNGKWGGIDIYGKEVVPCKYDDVALSFSEGLARVILNGKWGFIDTSGREVVPCKYDYVLDFKDGLSEAILNDKWGYIDKQGNWYNEMPSTLPESINRITISDIRYMVNECIKRLI